MTRLDDALARATQVLDALGKRHALVGGIAVSVLAVPRSTGDVDFAVAVADDGEAESVGRSLIAAGYEVSSLLEQQETNRLAGIRVHDAVSGVSLDLLFAMSGIEPEIAASARLVEVMPGTTMPVATVGSLIVTKLLARDDRRRPMDADDLRSLADVASGDDWDEARQLVALVAERGANRGRDLAADLLHLEKHGAY